jgi:hypothetical protein
LETGRKPWAKIRRFGMVLSVAHLGTIVWFIYAFIIELSSILDLAQDLVYAFII